MTLVGMSFDWVAFDSSRFLISLIISVKVTFLNEEIVGNKSSLDCVVLQQEETGLHLCSLFFNLDLHHGVTVGKSTRKTLATWTISLTQDKKCEISIHFNVSVFCLKMYCLV